MTQRFITQQQHSF